MGIKRRDITAALMKSRLQCKSRGRTPALSSFLKGSLGGSLHHRAMAAASGPVQFCTMGFSKVSGKLRRLMRGYIVGDG